MQHTTSIKKIERKKGVMQNGKLWLPNGKIKCYWQAICDMDTKLYYTNNPTPKSKIVVKLNTKTITQQGQKTKTKKALLAKQAVLVQYLSTKLQTLALKTLTYMLAF